jgi:gamma-glutamyl-gamma-aminobutyrate hydrolase PuuD
VSAIVAVSAPRRTDDGRERVALNSAYVAALARAGLVPVIVPPILDPDRAPDVLDHVRGLVLTGGEDVDPARYHAAPHPKLGATDAARDAMEVALIARAHERGLPILAICRGIQILNVALGGTLYQDLPSERPSAIHHAGPAARHPLRVESGSRLYGAVGAAATSVNSRHHQAIRDLAPGLRATAWAADDLIEGVERANGARPWTLAVQWHPEDDVEVGLFERFAEAVR